MNDKIKNKLKNIPNTSGIYKFLNDKGNIIYIGKSVNLKSRVNSYFNSKTKLNFAKQKMVKQINDIQTIITQNETESLILETNLIKENLPKYNILMKDGKNHNYIKITNEEYPKIIRTRVKIGKGIFYGPYISANDVDNILKILKKIYGYGVGEYNFFKSQNSYNLDKYLFEGNIQIKDKEEIKKIYHKKLEKIKYFLKGNYKEIIEKLREQMLDYANNHDFERADIIKKQIDSIEALNEKQIVRDGVKGDFNIINYIDKFDKIYIGKIEIRDSKIIGFYPYEIENKLDEKIEIILENFIKNDYINSILSDTESKKPILITNKKIKLNEEIFNKIKIETPKKGTKNDLLKMCYKNIYEYAYKKHLDSLSTKGFTKQTMQSLLNILGYKQINKNIIFECNDISHISGNHTVASRSIIENGKSNTSKYKKYKIKTLDEQKIDDFNSMREVITRRLQEIKKLKNTPDLIIIDGGKGQLSSVIEIINQNKVDLQVVGIAKKEEELFLPGKKESIILSKDSNELRLVQKIRDEAHRFAITFNRDTRIKSMKKNILEELPGFGPKTRKKILNKYGNIENLKNIDKNELLKIVNKAQLEILENHGLI
ncbi:excinuclease ABC subunit UvrC [Candidatus Gracilibacteria bacterium]|nr:excinuclease ABC subunit UvrC [Candidatus Gracilibacteria bacterium]